MAHKAAEILKVMCYCDVIITSRIHSQDPVNNAVVISGCGTSGRLAFSAVVSWPIVTT